MKALLLAAGKGSRISKYLSGNPKCTVDIGGTSLIEYTIKLLISKGISDIGIVVGYSFQDITKILAKYKVTIFYNYFYDVTNSIASAWFARDFFDDDMIVMNADVYVEKSVIDILLNLKISPVLLSDENRIKEADYRLNYINNVLVNYGKELSNEDTTGEYVGIAKFSKEYAKKFVSKLDDLIRTQKHSFWWENVLYELSKAETVFVKDVGGSFWAEVDFIEDYERILEHRGYSLKDCLKIDISKAI